MVLGGAITLAACTGSGYEAVSDPDANAPAAAVTAAPRVSGVLFVERTLGGATEDVQVGARFQRVVGLADDALPDLVGTPVIPRVGACVERTSPSATTDATAASAEVRLLDVGPVDVRAGDLPVRLLPRRFPDLWNVVSGVLYGVAPVALPQGAWRFTAQGDARSGVGAFDVEGQAPDDLMGVRVGEVPLPLPSNSAAVLPRHGALNVRWNRGYTDDKIAVVFEGAGTMVCGARDEGWLDIDAATMDRVADLLRNGGTLSVHRLRARPFTATGLDGASLVFDLAVRSHVQVE